MLGRVSMDMISIDITDIEDALVGDEVTLMGTDGGLSIGANDLASWAATSPYEILARISPRVYRRCLK